MAKRNTDEVIGKQFGKWTVTSDVDCKGPRRVTVRCNCGTQKEIELSRLRLSGGCAHCAHKWRPHEMSKHPIHASWRTARHRCNIPTNKQYPYYGGRGIKFCERWNSFVNFRDDMLPSWQPGLTLDRIDNDGDYAPENCRWITQAAQINNQRKPVKGLRRWGSGFRVPVAFAYFESVEEATAARKEAERNFAASNEL